jgi:hypothetical protein
MASREYLEYDPKQGWPAGADLFYECQRCKKILRSTPDINEWCECFNICIDIDAGRLAAKDESLVKLIRIRN